MESKPSKREYPVLMIKESKFDEFMKIARNYGFKDRNVGLRGELCRKERNGREICIRTEMDDPMQREIWFMLPRIGGTCQPDVVAPYVADLSLDGFAERME